LGKIEYNEPMRKYLLLVLCTLYLVLFVSTGQANAGWDCDPNAIPGVAMIPGPPMIPAIPPQARCVESATNTAFRTLRGCLRCEDDLTLNEKPYTDPAPPNVVTPCSVGGGGPTNLCVDDPRYVMRNFAALNFWSIGRGLSLAVPLVIVGGGLLCLVFMLFGAYTYVTSHGEEKKLTDAMHMMTYAALGLIVIVLGYAIVRTVLFITKINTFGF
jgi:hypothetical protein